jgi:hypothetical protein
MVSHQLKSWPANFEAIKKGVVSSTVRAEEDRTFAVDDELHFWLAAGPEESRIYGLDVGTIMPGRPLRAIVTHVTRTAGPLSLFGIKLTDGSSAGMLKKLAVVHFHLLGT